jgi:protein tyrosine phosphatase (PTP) superfamily phosphohydrolase (DUF442 family)
MGASSSERVRYDASKIADGLFVGSLPHDDDVDDIRELGVDLVLSMIRARPPGALMQPPFRLLTLVTYDWPGLPIPLDKLRRGVATALPVLDAGGCVLVYCRQGRHRSVTMACSILIAQGMSAAEAMDLVVAGRPIADPHAFYIEPRIRAFEADWHCRQQEAATRLAGARKA